MAQPPRQGFAGPGGHDEFMVVSGVSPGKLPINKQPFNETGLGATGG
jgi:hypothetical protein